MEKYFWAKYLSYGLEVCSMQLSHQNYFFLPVLFIFYFWATNFLLKLKNLFNYKNNITKSNVHIKNVIISFSSHSMCAHYTIKNVFKEKVILVSCLFSTLYFVCFFSKMEHRHLSHYFNVCVVVHCMYDSIIMSLCIFLWKI